MQHIIIHTGNPKALLMDGYIELLKGESMQLIIIYTVNPKVMWVLLKSVTRRARSRWQDQGQARARAPKQVSMYHVGVGVGDAEYRGVHLGTNWHNGYS